MTSLSKYVPASLLCFLFAAGCSAGPKPSPARTAVSKATEPRTFYCSPGGTDSPEAGTAGRPWRAIGYALDRIGPAGGAILVLADGDYPKPRGGRWQFEVPVTVRAQNALGARVERITLAGARNLVFEGIRFDRRSAESGHNVVHFQRGTSYCTLRKCLMTHGAGGYQNTDSLKINAGAHHILVEENIILDGTDEEVDLLGEVHDIVFRRNIIYQSKVSKAEAMLSNKWNAYRMMFDGNLFANLNPESSNGALRFGGSETHGKEAHTLVAINNLFVNTRGRGAMTFVGATKCLVADNIFVNHNDERTGAVAIYSNYPKQDIANDHLFIIHNIFHEADGRWTKPVYAFIAHTPKTWRISHNLYWNGGKPVAGDRWHDPVKEQGVLLEKPFFTGDPRKLAGTPDTTWFKVLELREDSPFHRSAVDLEKLDLPAELRRFLEDYRYGRRDAWYRAIGKKRP